MAHYTSRCIQVRSLSCNGSESSSNSTCVWCSACQAIGTVILIDTIKVPQNYLPVFLWIAQFYTSWCLNTSANMKLGWPVLSSLSMIVSAIIPMHDIETSWAEFVRLGKSSAWPPHVSKHRIESSCLLLSTLQPCFQSYNSPLRGSHLPQHCPL